MKLNFITSSENARSYKICTYVVKKYVNTPDKSSMELIILLSLTASINLFICFDVLWQHYIY